MADRPIRVGQVSAVDLEQGMIRVVYNDMDSAVSPWLPYLAFGNEYHMPDVDDYVVVLHMTNGQEAGIVLGRYWNQKHTPPANGKDVYRKDFSNSPGKAYLQRDPGEAQKIMLVLDLMLQMTVSNALSVTSEKDMTLKGSEITLTSNGGSVTVSQIIQHINSH